MYYSPLIHKAIEFAIKVHETDSHKKRKGKDIPYIVHPLTVGLILSRVTNNENIISAGILHDTIEDCEPYGSVTHDTIAQMFNLEVADLVDSVTEKDKNLPWAERKQLALDDIKNMTHDQQLVKSADVLNNLSDLVEDIQREGTKIFKNFNSDQSHTVTRYENLLQELTSSWDTNPILPELKDSTNKLLKLTG